MSIGFTFSACSFFYVLLLTLVFFSKKRLNTLENKIYGALIITSLCGVILAVSCYYTTLHYETFKIFSMIVSKGLLIYYLLYLVLVTAYVYVISRKVQYNTVTTRNKIAFCGAAIVFFVASLLVCIFPLHFYRNGTVCYTYGPSANIVYLFSGIAIFLWVVLMFINYKELRDKKYLPMFAFIFLGTIVMYIQKRNPGLLLLTSMEAFVTFLMYFTIENPDMKLIEELNIAKDQAERANHAKSDFLSNMSHEIRTPLNAIVGFSQTLLEEEISDSAKEQVEDIISASESLLEIVNGVLDISKIEANKLEIINTEYEFRKILNELISLTKVRIGEKPIDLITKFDPEIPFVLYGDHVRMKQIILNLLTNAAKYTNEGVIEFTVSVVRSGEICRLIISVADTGIGIKKENIDKLFTKFERCEIEKSATIEGTGLGLAITKKLVELMNGKIVVQSVYGQGSRFTVAIDQKIVTKVKTTEVVSTVDGVVDCSGKRILIVDDNPMNLKVAARLLKNYNVEIDQADSGFQCIDKITSGEQYDLILLDDMMPRMSGVDTLKKLKEMDGFSVPTVALTANAISGMREKYLADGFDDYLPKPINKAELNQVLQKFLK